MRPQKWDVTEFHIYEIGNIAINLFQGRGFNSPFHHAILFASVFVFLPMPHYFTMVNSQYSQTLRSWLALMAVIVLMRRARNDTRSATTG